MVGAQSRQPMSSFFFFSFSSSINTPNAIISVPHSFSSQRSVSPRPPQEQTHDPPQARVRIVSRLVHPLLLGDLVLGVDETVLKKDKTVSPSCAVARRAASYDRSGRELRGKMLWQQRQLHGAGVAWGDRGARGSVLTPSLREWSGDAVGGGLVVVLARAEVVVRCFACEASSRSGVVAS